MVTVGERIGSSWTSSTNKYDFLHRKAVQSLRTHTSACSDQTNTSSQLIQTAKLHLHPVTWSFNPILCNPILNLLCMLSGPSYYLQEAPDQQELPSMGAEQLFPIDGGKEEAYTAKQLAKINLPINLSPSNSARDLSIKQVFIINTFLHERARIINTSDPHSPRDALT